MDSTGAVITRKWVVTLLHTLSLAIPATVGCSRYTAEGKQQSQQRQQESSKPPRSVGSDRWTR